MQIDRTGGEAELVAIGAGQKIVTAGAFGAIHFDRKIMAQKPGLALPVGQAVVEPALIRVNMAPIGEVVQIADHTLAGRHPQQVGAAGGKTAIDQGPMKALELRVGERPRPAATGPAGLMQPAQPAQKILRLRKAAGAADDERSERPIAALGPADLVARVATRVVESAPARAAQGFEIDKRRRPHIPDMNGGAELPRRHDVILVDAADDKAPPPARPPSGADRPVHRLLQAQREQRAGAAALDQNAVMLDEDVVVS